MFINETFKIRNRVEPNLVYCNYYYSVLINRNSENVDIFKLANIVQSLTAAKHLQSLAVIAMW